MSTRVLRTLIVSGCLAAAAVHAGAPAAAAESALAELRVEGPAGALDPGTWYVTDTERIRESRSGDACVRSDGRLKFPGPSALGILQSGSEHTRALRQVRVRLDEAGPFVCEIGSIRGRPFGDPEGFSGWTYWIDFASGTSSADLATVVDGSRVLWVYSDFGSASTNTGDALELRGVPAYDPDGSFEVEVLAHAFDGSTAPADGATIAGATTTTALGGGRYAVTVSPGDSTLNATRGSDIPSNRLTACVDDDASKCPSKHGRRIFGSERRDRIAGTGGWDRIDTGPGKDRIDLRDGGVDRVKCRGGKDKVLVSEGDEDDRIARSCERIRRR